MINLSPKAVEAISTLQKSPIMVSMITDSEDFILENVDDESLYREALANIKGLRMVRRLLEDIVIKESES